MGSLFYFAFITIELFSVVSTEPLSLKCFLQGYQHLNLFNTSTVGSWSSTTNPLLFNTVKVKSASVDKDGWFFGATNLEYHGLDDAVLDDFGFNLVTHVSQLTFHTDVLVTNTYKTNGTLLSMPINGEGFSEVRLKNIQFSLNMSFDVLKNKTKSNKYIELRNFNYWYNVKDNAEFRLSNLYNGNKELSDTMHNLINQNWKMLTSRYGKNFLDEVVENIFNKLSNYMRSMPLRDFATCK